MKIYYLNDEHEPVLVRVNHQFTFDPANPFAQPKHDYVHLAPAESRVFDIDAPEGSIPFVKRWERRVVLLSYILPEALKQLEEPSDTKSSDAPVDT